MASQPQQRLASLQRHFTSSQRKPQEVQDAYIISAVRTPVGVFNGSLSSVSAPQLGATAIREAISRSSIPTDKITHVYMGNVLQGGVGQAPARQATIFAGLSPSVESTTINKVCASGMKAISIAAQQIELGQESALVAGGMENMSQVPYYLKRAAQQPPFGEQKMEDGLIKDGLWDVYNQVHMGNCAEETAKKYQITREEQDEFAILSYKRAQESWRNKAFEEEIVPVTVKGKKGETVVSEDEGYNRLKLEKVPTLKPAFDRSGNGTVTAANSSSFNDGASAVVLVNRELAKEHGKGKRVLARICGYADAAIDPIDFPVAPAKVVPIALARAGISVEDVKIWEFNEAFAAVIKANAKILNLGVDNVNPRGGAIALGHALGSSGSRIITTLLHQLKKGEYGCAAICNGGGAATGMVVQMVDAEDL
ncbi:Acetyl-CoA acetyltransferase erg10A, mitochondrial [Vermiconidia calcicola]|uniref:Acetyl-CoA acetyltransferase erg10A, mitochondrial n=1 Tax=Vermiconidia calcicola TaxID=1690605 RepID=A0ACC3N879_9PEZI|nr:Acetyl-CoA acetyltransferase erg10A, mitochondrial [Vermiconidia calcicola]